MAMSHSFRGQTPSTLGHLAHKWLSPIHVFKRPDMPCSLPLRKLCTGRVNDVSSLTAQRSGSKGVNVSKKQQNMVIWGQFEANGSLQMIAQNIPVWENIQCDMWHS